MTRSALAFLLLIVAQLAAFAADLPALTGRVVENLYVGFNVQYQRAYQGLTFGEFTGEALYLGPTLFAKVGDNGFLSLAWNRQVWGGEVGNAARLDLANFERDLFRVRAGIHF